MRVPKGQSAPGKAPDIFQHFLNSYVLHGIILAVEFQIQEEISWLLWSLLALVAASSWALCLRSRLLAMFEIHVQ